MLVTTRHIGESIIINGNVEITVLGIRGSRVKLGTIAPREVIIARQERKHLRFSEAEMSALAALNEDFTRRHPPQMENPVNENDDPSSPISVIHTPRTQKNLAQMLEDDQASIHLSLPMTTSASGSDLDTLDGFSVIPVMSELAERAKGAEGAVDKLYRLCSDQNPRSDEFR